MKRLSEKFYPGLIYASIIMLLMGLPGRCFPTVVCFWDWLGPDKIVHILLFTALPLISLWGYRKLLLTTNYPHKKRIYLIVGLVSVSYGALTELMQKYIFINRYGCYFDFFADTIGCILGMLIFMFLVQKKIKKSEDNL